MMVVVTLSCCPPKLRGDLTKWLMEIDTGVFVGNLSARVRDAVWERICENIRNGRATMAFSAGGEQKLDFRIYNTDWEPIDYDGIKLVRRNYPQDEDERYRQQSNMNQHHIETLVQRKQKASGMADNYVVIDIETTGLNESDHIIELGAVRIINGHPEAKLSILVQCKKTIPDDIVELTGINDVLLKQQGIDEKSALEQFCNFCGDQELVGHNIMFDMRFIRSALARNNLPILRNRTTDTMRLSRRKLSCAGYGLKMVADELQIPYEHVHRALDDCMLTYRIFEKLKEI